MGFRRLYKAASPFVNTELAAIDYAQSADVLYISHQGYDPVKFLRYGHTDWRWSTIVFGPINSPPTGVSVAASEPNTTGAITQTYSYVVTSISDGSPAQETRPSIILSCNNDLTLNGNFNTITVPAPSGTVTRHVVYKLQGGIYGYIGETDGTAVVDKNLQPILSTAPPSGTNPFAGIGNKPGAVAFHQQRLFFGGSLNVINGVWASRSADPENMDVSRPARADDALSFALLADKVNAVTSLTSLQELLVLSTDSVFSIQGNASGVVTPSDINPKRSTGRGARKVKPLTLDTVTFFVTARGNAVRTLGYSFDIAGYKTDNMAIFAPHLFRQYSVKKMVYQEEPFSCVFCLREDGLLLAFTWEQEQEVWGWSTIVTQGTVEDIEVIPESGYDRLYARIRRTINGVERLFHERMALPHIEIEQACHLDCAYTRVYTTPVSRITGAFHLAGATVSMIYDGYVETNLVVSACDGGVDIPNGGTASTITIGLPYAGRVETLPAALKSWQGPVGHVNRQQIKDIVVRAIDTRGIEIGTPSTPLEMVEPKDGEDAVPLTDVSAVDYRVDTPGNWTDLATIVIEQNQPLPAHIVAIFADVLTSND